MLNGTAWKNSAEGWSSKLEALKNEQDMLRKAQTTLAQTEQTPVAFIEEVPDKEENLIYIKTTAQNNQTQCNLRKKFPG